MRYDYNWLKEYYKTEESAEKIVELMTRLGSEAEKITSTIIDPDIITAKILNIKSHPNADRLRLVTVTDGKKEITVVCGAPNIKEDQVVPLAIPGVKLTSFTSDGCKKGEIEVKEVEIRGIKSPGMLLSERELGISNDHEGIKILPENTKLGVSVADILNPGKIIEAEITPNRGDLLSHYGMARDLSAASGKSVIKTDLELKESSSKADKEISIEIKSDKCSLYVAKVIRGVKIKESPKWLKDRLLSCGINPVNNVVDVTNYIMFDLGHPLHAFDANKIISKKIVIDDVKKEEDIMCLDGKGRALIPGMLCIYDKQNPIAIAGVIGLECSQIDETTADVILEAAVFEPASIRKTAKLLNIKTEASYRFERGVDDRGVSYAIKKAAKMIVEIAGGEILSGEVTAGDVNKQKSVKIEYDDISKLIGLHYSKDEIDESLKALGFEINDGYAYVPSWRHDIEFWQDLAEEVARLNGLQKIKVEPIIQAHNPPKSDYYKKEKIKDILVNLGLDEAITYTFLSDSDIKTAKLDAENLLEVANPVQIENRYLRNSLIPGLLKVVSKAPSFDNIELFEMGHIFDKDKERESLAIVSCGKSARKAEEIIKSFIKEIKIDIKQFLIYELSREELKRFKIKKPSVYVAEIDVDKLLSKAEFSNLRVIDQFKKINYRPISKFPPVSRDLAFILDSRIGLEQIKNTIVKSSQAVVLAEPFDEFINNRFGEGKKSVAFHIYLQDMDKTMSDSEAEIELGKIINSLQREFDSEIRN